MNKHLLVAVISGLVLTTNIGCGDVSEPAPEPEPNIILSLQTSNSRGFLEAYATVINAGSVPVLFPAGCGCGVILGVLDEEGNAVELQCDPGPSCLCNEVILEPDQILEKLLEFRGVICVDGEPVEVSSGNYQVIAGFGYRLESDDAEDGYRELTREYDFTWE